MVENEIIEEWLRSSDYSDSKGGRVLLIALFRDFICFCAKNDYDVPPITDRRLSDVLQELGYEKVQTCNGMAFVMK